MDITILNQSDRPIYQQIYEQVSAQIMKGQLEQGACLPPIRTVARELRVSVITVKKAWEELERGGFIYAVVGKGCFVAPLNHGEREEKRLTLAAERLQRELPYYRELGLSLEELVRLVEKYYKE